MKSILQWISAMPKHGFVQPARSSTKHSRLCLKIWILLKQMPTFDPVDKILYECDFKELKDQSGPYPQLTHYGKRWVRPLGTLQGIDVLLPCSKILVLRQADPLNSDLTSGFS